MALLPRLHRLAWVIAHDEQDARDLSQATVERALQRQGQWQDDTRLDHWLFRIMRNIWIDRKRAGKRWGRLVVSIVDVEDVTDDGDRMRAIETSIEMKQMREMVEQLPEEQRLAVKLVLLGGLSYGEAAAMLEIPEGTLASRLGRGRSALLAGFRRKEERNEH